mmetsp:Transcript_2632/g.7251  ORF Transcript_2632/g.7251 Transcript_2632/m.7251 type:complete len:215 (-) Transcript_2632:406-1050(-)
MSRRVNFFFAISGQTRQGCFGRRAQGEPLCDWSESQWAENSLSFSPHALIRISFGIKNKPGVANILAPILSSAFAYSSRTKRHTTPPRRWTDPRARQSRLGRQRLISSLLHTLNQSLSPPRCLPFINLVSIHVDKGCLKLRITKSCYGTKVSVMAKSLRWNSTRLPRMFGNIKESSSTPQASTPDNSAFADHAMEPTTGGVPFLVGPNVFVSHH